MLKTLVLPRELRLGDLRLRNLRPGHLRHRRRLRGVVATEWRLRRWRDQPDDLIIIKDAGPGLAEALPISLQLGRPSCDLSGEIEVSASMR